jgi:hypothetical protein
MKVYSYEKFLSTTQNLNLSKANAIKKYNI